MLDPICLKSPGGDVSISVMGNCLGLVYVHVD